MTLKLTTDILRAAYDYLNATPPFNRWNLPDGEDVTFSISKNSETMGRYWMTNDRHNIEVSERLIARTESLMSLMAHEMIHLHEHHANASNGAAHSAAFKRWATQVCRVHGFDASLF